MQQKVNAYFFYKIYNIKKKKNKINVFINYIRFITNLLNTTLHHNVIPVHCTIEY